MVGYRLADGSVLENQQLEPDVKVANTPGESWLELMPSFKAAVEELLRQIDSAK